MTNPTETCCKRCGTVFTVSTDRKIYCSNKCYRGERKSLICKRCDKVFSIPNYVLNRGNRGVYCSSACAKGQKLYRKCKRCGIEFRTCKSRNGIYCSAACSFNGMIQTTCSYCKCAITVAPSRLGYNKGIKYCSKACQYLGMRANPAKEALRYRICDNCNQPFNAPCHKSTRFCSRECYHNNRKGFVMRPKAFEGPTSIERAVYAALSELCIFYEREVLIGTYFADVYIPLTNTVIECQGDYWHCNPERYPEGPKDKMQRQNVIRDEHKLDYLLGCGYNVIYVWERDINKYGAMRILDDYLDNLLLTT